MNEEHKDKSGRPEERFSELGQRAGAVLGQLFAAAEQFGQQVSKESEAWSESGSSREPFVSALRQASEEFRATADRVAENFSDSVQQGQADAAVGDPQAEGSDGASDGEIKPGTVHKIGGGAVDSNWSASAGPVRSYGAGDESKSNGLNDRVEQLAEIFRADDGLAELTPEQFYALKATLDKQYRGLREFLDTMRAK